MSGLSVGTVSRAEQGKDVSLSHAMRMSQALDRSIEELWALDETEPQKTAAGPSVEDIERLADTLGMGYSAATERQAARTSAEVLPGAAPHAGNGGADAAPPGCGNFRCSPFAAKNL